MVAALLVAAMPVTSYGRSTAGRGKGAVAGYIEDNCYYSLDGAFITNLTSYPQQAKSAAQATRDADAHRTSTTNAQAAGYADAHRASKAHGHVHHAAFKPTPATYAAQATRNAAADANYRRTVLEVQERLAVVKGRQSSSAALACHCYSTNARPSRSRNNWADANCIDDAKDDDAIDPETNTSAKVGDDVGSKPSPASRASQSKLYDYLGRPTSEREHSNDVGSKPSPASRASQSKLYD